MGWFGILAETDDPADLFRVHRCHLNWWALPSLFPGRRLFFLDIGLSLTAPAKPLSAIDFAMPFQVEKVRWDDSGLSLVDDLYEALEKEEVRHLVFGEAVQGTGTPNGFKLSFVDGTEMTMARIDAAKAELLDAGGTRYDLSFVRVPLVHAIPAGETRYIRFRVSIYRTGNVWRWRRDWLGKSGAQVDLRIADVREAFRHQGERVYWKRLVPIDHVNVFFIVPTEFQELMTSPPIHYARPLEPGVWGQYLERARYRRPLRNLRVHYWKYPDSELSVISPSGSAPGPPVTPANAKPVTMENPLRVFLDLARVSAAARWVSTARTTLAVVVGLVIVDRASIFGFQPPHVEVDTVTALKWLLGSSVASIGAGLAFYRKWGSGRLTPIRLACRRFERWLLALSRQR